MISRLHNNVAGRLQFFKSLLPYSTTAAAAQPQTHFLVPHLVTLLGFSKEEAISAVKKVNLRQSSRKDPNLVINFFQNLGLDKSQIKTIVSRDSKLLLCDVDKSLKPKVRIFQELGLSGSDLNKLIVTNEWVLSGGVNSALRYPIERLRKLLGSDENVAKAIKKFPPLLVFSKLNNVELNVELLKMTGFSNESVVKFILLFPRRITYNRDWLEDVLHRVEYAYGISHESKMFYYGVEVISGLKKSTVDSKFGMFRSFGFSDEQIYGMFRIFPYVLGKSEAKVRGTVQFFGELGYTLDYLASAPVVFGLSLEKRMRPRYELLKILQEKKLINKRPELYSFFRIAESKFVNSFLWPYKDEIPYLYQSYMKIVGS